MSNRKRIRRDFEPLASSAGPEDGIDPRYLPRCDGRRSGPGRKSLQLCEQVAQTLSLVLASEFDDAVLRDLTVSEVVPAPDASHLLVTLALSPSAEPHGIAEVLERLAAHAARLRAEVASAIHRRRVPQLTYRLMS
jgi:ribosome-binding factor A